jgi:hypothetical protein
MTLPDLRETERSGNQARAADNERGRQLHKASLRLKRQLRASYRASASKLGRKKSRMEQGTLPNLDLTANQVAELQAASRTWGSIDPVRRVWVPKSMLGGAAASPNRHATTTLSNGEHQHDARGNAKHTDAQQRRRKMIKSKAYLLSSQPNTPLPIASPNGPGGLELNSPYSGFTQPDRKGRVFAGPVLNLASPCQVHRNSLEPSRIKRREFAKANRTLGETFEQELHERSASQLEAIMVVSQDGDEDCDDETESGTVSPSLPRGLNFIMSDMCAD